MATKIQAFNLHTNVDTHIKGIIDSNYILARSPAGTDSAAVLAIIDSDYVKNTLKVNSVYSTFRYTATEGQTAFTGTDLDNKTLAYEPGSTRVFLNGSLLTPTQDYSLDSGDTITLGIGAGAGSEVVIDTFVGGQIAPASFLSLNGGTLTGNLILDNDSKIVFEGSSADSNETTLAVANPTADRTITIPNVTGTVITTGNINDMSQQDHGLITGSVDSSSQNDFGSIA